MGKIRQYIDNLTAATLITLSSACVIPNIGTTIDSVVNSAQEHIAEFVESNEDTKPLFKTFISKELDEFNDWKDSQINSFFGLVTITSSQRTTTVDFDSFADIDSTIVTDFAARYSNPLEMKPFLVDTLDFVSAGSMYGKSLYIPSTKVVLSENAGVCLSASVSLIPAALEDDKYLPIVLMMYNKETILNEDLNIRFTGPGSGHAVFLYHNNLIGDTPSSYHYDSNSSILNLSFREFMHNQPGWYTAGINSHDFAGPYDSVNDIVKHYSYCNSVILNLNDYDVDFQYSNDNLWDSLPNRSDAEIRQDLEDDFKINLNNRVTILIDNETNIPPTQFPINYISFLQNQD